MARAHMRVTRLGVKLHGTGTYKVPKVREKVHATGHVRGIME
jgi:hypothetical protein